MHGRISKCVDSSLFLLKNRVFSLKTNPFHFQQVRHGIKNNTVDKLKQILANLNSECGTHLSRTGKKQDLIDRIVEILDQWRKTMDEERWTKARTIIYQIRNTGV